MSKPAEQFWVNGIVAHRDKRPYIQLSNEHGLVAQLTPAQAFQIATDIFTMTARTEVDAMIHDFFSKAGFPEEAGAALMTEFREFRAKIDDEKINHTHRGEV